MRIITISRQFGSGGRELGKRLSDILCWDYYDKEIIRQLAEENGLDQEYVRSVLSKHEWRDFSISYRNSFSNMSPDQSMRISLMRAQREIIENIAAAGNDCIIIGRDADIILKDYNPFRVFVCADMDRRLERCMKFENKKESNRLTEKEVLRNIKSIDRERSQIREMLTGKAWGDSTAFDLVVNTGSREIKLLSEAVAGYALRWFEK